MVHAEARRRGDVLAQSREALRSRREAACRISARSRASASRLRVSAPPRLVCANRSRGDLRMTVRARVIPCLDVAERPRRQGRQLRRPASTPAIRSSRRAPMTPPGADELCFLDIGASHEGRGTILDVVRRTAAVCFMPLTVGGGVRSADDARALLLAGADKVAVNSAAVARPELVADIAERFGSQCCVASIDARRVGRRLGSLHPRRPPRHRHRRGRPRAAPRRTRRGRAARHLDGPRRHARRLRPRADPRDRRPRRACRSSPRAASAALDDLVAGIVEGHACAVLAASIFHFGEASDRRRPRARSRRRGCRSGRANPIATLVRRPSPRRRWMPAAYRRLAAIPARRIAAHRARTVRPRAVRGRRRRGLVRPPRAASPLQRSAGLTARPPRATRRHGDDTSTASKPRSAPAATRPRDAPTPRSSSRSGRATIAQKLGEEAVETVIAAIGRRPGQDRPRGRRPDLPPPRPARRRRPDPRRRPRRTDRREGVSGHRREGRPPPLNPEPVHADRRHPAL